MVPDESMPVKTLRTLALLPLFGLLSGCNMVLMQPSGDIATRQRDLILASTGLMLLIIIPVIAFTLLFAWRYRVSNTKAEYDPDWHHSTQLEVVIWAAPLVIIIALGALTWISTHTLDPYRPIARLDASRPIPAGTKRLQVEVVALDWKWLFFYPEQGIATVNELAAPVDVPIDFVTTSATPSDSNTARRRAAISECCDKGVMPLQVILAQRVELLATVLESAELPSVLVDHDPLHDAAAADEDPIMAAVRLA